MPQTAVRALETRLSPHPERPRKKYNNGLVFISVHEKSTAVRYRAFSERRGYYEKNALPFIADTSYQMLLLTFTDIFFL